ncbi:hypothetical protein [Dinoroseobacter sp. S124A]|uniref:hypothetical protein n=1 Tax=Dinoroseobacter sp. S124A TaxID=3415128 RepID=UPI003C7E321C
MIVYVLVIHMMVPTGQIAQSLFPFATLLECEAAGKALGAASFPMQFQCIAAGSEVAS